MSDQSWIWPALFSMVILVFVIAWVRTRWADDGLAALLLWGFGILVAVAGWLGWMLGSPG